MEPVQDQRDRTMPTEERQNGILQTSLAVHVESQAISSQAITQQERQDEPQKRE